MAVVFCAKRMKLKIFHASIWVMNTSPASSACPFIVHPSPRKHAVALQKPVLMIKKVPGSSCLLSKVPGAY